MEYRVSSIDAINGFEPLKKIEPLNGVIFTTSTKKVLNIILITASHTAMTFLAMCTYFPLLCKTGILEAAVLLNALDVGTSEILHISNFPPLSRATNFM